MKKIDKIIQMIRENMTSSGAELPTNNISGKNIATFDPILSFKRRKNGNVDGRSVSQEYKRWLKSLRLM